MRPLACLLALAAPLAAQDAWTARLTAHRARQRPEAEFCLLVRPDGDAWRGDWSLDERLALLVHAADVQVATFEKGEAEALAQRQGWGPQPRWVLLSPQGEVVASGTRAPEAQVLKEAFDRLGWVSRPARRERFLAEHPDQGDARLEAMEEAVEMAVAPLVKRFSRSEDGPAKPLTQGELEVEQRLWRKATETLAGLRKVEGWVDHPRLAEAIVRVGWGRAEEGEGELLQAPLREVRLEVERVLSRRPGQSPLWGAWGHLALFDPQSSAGALLSALSPLPGGPPLPVGAADPLRTYFWLKEDWAGAEQLSRQVLQTVWPKAQGWTRMELRQRQDSLAAWVPLGAMGLANQGRVQEALDLVEQARQVVGPAWTRLLRGTRIAVGLSLRDESRREAFRAIYRQPALPDPPVAPDPPALRAVLLGVPGWKGAWDRLRRHEAFDAFGGAELQWVDLPAKEQTALRRAREWNDAPRWVLLRGEDVVATGTGLPRAEALADAARAEGRPRLEVLRDFVAAHPDHDEARDQLQAALANRMPHPRLEVQLLAQAARTLKPFRVENLEQADGGQGWKPLPELWQGPARRALPALEARLRRWPESLELWQAWLDWAAVADTAPDPAALLASLPIWKTRARGGPGPLPSDIVLKVLLDLRDAQRWEALAGWCRAVWEGGLHAQLKAAFGAPQDAPGEGGRGQEVVRLGQVVVAAFDLALDRLGRTGELARLRAEVADLRGVAFKLEVRGRMPSPRPPKAPGS